MNNTRNSESYSDFREDSALLQQSLRTLSTALYSHSETDDFLSVPNELEIESAKGIVLDQVGKEFRSADKSLDYWEMSPKLAKTLIPLMIENLESSVLVNLLNLNGCKTIRELLAKI